MRYIKRRVLRSLPGVHPWVVGLGTPISPADHAYEGVAPRLLSHQGAAGVTLAGVLARGRGTQAHPGTEKGISKIFLSLNMEVKKRRRDSVEILCFLVRRNLLSSKLYSPSNVSAISQGALGISGHCHLHLLQTGGLAAS